MKKYNYKFIVSKNNKKYYKNDSGKWKPVSNKTGEKAERGKRKYRIDEYIRGNAYTILKQNKVSIPIGSKKPSEFRILSRKGEDITAENRLHVYFQQKVNNEWKDIESLITNDACNKLRLGPLHSKVLTENNTLKQKIERLQKELSDMLRESGLSASKSSEYEKIYNKFLKEMENYLDRLRGI